MPQNKFQIDLPLEDWNDQTIYSFKGPTVEGRDHTLLLAIDRKPQHANVVDFAQNQIKIIEENLPSITVYKKQETTLPKGNPVFEYLIEWKPSEKWSSYKKYVFVFVDNRGFTFNLDFSAVSYQLLNKSMKTLIESFLPGTFQND